MNRDHWLILGIVAALIVASTIAFLPNDNDDDGECHHEFVDAYPIVNYVDITIDDDNNIHIVWRDDSSEYSTQTHFKNGYFLKLNQSGNATFDEVFYSGAWNEMIGIPKIFVDETGASHIFYEDRWLTVDDEGIILKNSTLNITINRDYHWSRYTQTEDGNVAKLTTRYNEFKLYSSYYHEYMLFNLSIGQSDVQVEIPIQTASHVPNITYVAVGPYYIFEDENGRIQSYWRTESKTGLVNTNFSSDGTNWTEQVTLLTKWMNETDPGWVVGDRLSNGTIVLLFSEEDSFWDYHRARMLFLWPTGGYKIVHLFDTYGEYGLLSVSNMTMLIDDDDQINLLVIDTEEYSSRYSRNNTLYYSRYSTNGDLIVPLKKIADQEWSVAYDAVLDSNGHVNIVWGGYFFKMNNTGDQVTSMRYFIEHTTSREKGLYPSLEL